MSDVWCKHDNLEDRCPKCLAAALAAATARVKELEWAVRGFMNVVMGILLPRTPDTELLNAAVFVLRRTLSPPTDDGKGTP